MTVGWSSVSFDTPVMARPAAMTERKRASEAKGRTISQRPSEAASNPGRRASQRGRRADSASVKARSFLTSGSYAPPGSRVPA
jgi:hypothetical protein